MMMIKCLIALVMCLVVANANENEKKDHNHDAHGLLCDLLKVVAGKWEKRETLSPQLKKALGKTLFGKEDGDLQILRTKLPAEYEKVVGEADSRGFACGQPRNDEHDGYKGFGLEFQPRWSGHSGPHDMVCLCTLGNNSWPLDDIQTATTLCGHGKNALGSGKGKNGWSGIETGLDQITATWFNVIKHCLQGEKEKGEKLKEALEKFLGNLENKSNEFYTRYQLGEGNATVDHACTGTTLRGVCVMYYNGTIVKKDNMPWWTDLEKAIPEEEKFQKQREEEKRKQQDSQKNDAPRTEDFTSAPPTTNQADQQQNSNLTDKLRRFNLTSGTPISKPTSWLLSAALLI